MIKVAFCDDDVSVISELSAFMDKYKFANNCDMEYFAYQSPFELMAGIEQGSRFDVLILDIMMPGENGIELAREIRGFDENVKIIFLTSALEFAVDSYSVEAFYYLLKPVTEENFFPVFDRAVVRTEKSKSEKIVLKCKMGISTVDPKKIEYCEVIGHSLFLHIKGDAELESSGRLDELEEKLSMFGGFLRVHRSYLVNMACIQTITSQAVITSEGAEIPIPHGKYNEIKKAYLDYAFGTEGASL